MAYDAHTVSLGEASARKASMKTTARLVLLQAALAMLPFVVQAQETRIIGFTPLATLTWTNSQTNAYYAIEYTWDFDYGWTAVWDPALNLVATTSVSTAHVGEIADALSSQVWPLLKINPPLFYRIVSSTEPLSSRVVTNEVTLVNAGTSTLTGVSLGYQSPVGSRSQVVNLDDLAPGSNTEYHAFAETFPYSGPVSQLHGAFFHFEQAGVVRDRVVSFIWWGPPRKRLQITVSNDSYTVRAEWLNLQGTVPWGGVTPTASGTSP